MELARLLMSLGWGIVWIFFLLTMSCTSTDASARDDGGLSANPHAPDTGHVPELDIDVVASYRLPPTNLGVADDLVEWPRSHPAGTLLVDHLGELWMVVSGGVREQVSGDDTLGEVGLDEHDAIPMSAEEERCLTPSLDYWDPGNWHWWPVYGPTEEDPGPFILDWERYVRRPISLETLESWGYYTRWLDSFDGGEDEWSSYAFEDDPVPMRDGALVHTEHGFYYVVHGRSFFFNSLGLVSEAGYHPENALLIPDHRLRELAPASIAFTRETFALCPAEG